MSLRNPRPSVRVVSGVILALTAALGLGACSETTGVEQGTTIEEIQDDDDDAGYNGIYDSSFYGGMDDYVGETVTVSADVGRIVSDHAFTIAGGDVEELLIVDADKSVDLEVGSLIQVTGTVYQSFDLPAAEKRLDTDLDDEQFGPYDQEPYIEATSIETNPDTEED